MALIDCKLCGQKISSRAPFCPKCQFPTLHGEKAGVSISEQCRACRLSVDQLDVYCNLCPGATKVAVPGSFVRPFDQGTDSPGTTMRPVVAEHVSLIASRITGLRVQDAVKDHFRLFADHPEPRVLAGIPLFWKSDDRLKVWRLNRTGKSLASIPALCCGPFYYLALGLWRKGFVLLGILVSITIVAAIFFVNTWLVAILVGVGVVNFWSCGMVTYDRYRNLVLEKDFWW